MRAKIHVKDGNIADRCDHVEHYIETLDEQDLANQLTLLRLDDVDTLEATLHTYERMQKRKSNLRPVQASSAHGQHHHTPQVHLNRLEPCVQSTWGR